MRNSSRLEIIIVGEQKGNDMGKNFTYTVKSEPKTILAKLKELLKEHPDVPFEGNEKTGRLTKRFKGFEGSYKMKKVTSGTKVEITIDRKHKLATWGMIKSKLDAEGKNW